MNTPVDHEVHDKLRLAMRLVDKLDTITPVIDFHNAFEFPPAPLTPCIPDWDSLCAYEMDMAALWLEAAERRLRKVAKDYTKPPLCLLLAQLMISEQAELLRAMAAQDMVACLDAFGDKEVVDKGALHQLGLVPVFHEAFKRIHESNMSKLVNGKPVRDETGKIMKGDWYKPVKLGDLIP